MEGTKACLCRSTNAGQLLNGSRPALSERYAPKEVDASPLKKMCTVRLETCLSNLQPTPSCTEPRPPDATAKEGSQKHQSPPPFCAQFPAPNGSEDQSKAAFPADAAAAVGPGMVAKSVPRFTEFTVVAFRGTNIRVAMSAARIRTDVVATTVRWSGIRGYSLRPPRRDPDVLPQCKSAVTATSRRRVREKLPTHLLSRGCVVNCHRRVKGS